MINHHFNNNPIAIEVFIITVKGSTTVSTPQYILILNSLPNNYYYNKLLYTHFTKEKYRIEKNQNLNSKQNKT